MYDQFRRSLNNIEFLQGVPKHLDSDGYFDKTKANLVIMDDLMASTASNAAVADLFTEGSHHRNLSVINLTQNLFPVGKNATTQRRNTQYMIIFKSPMSQDQIRTLGTFMFPGRLPEFLNIYHLATGPPYGYLVIDAKPDTPDNQRFKHNILSIKEEPQLQSSQSALKRQASNSNKMVSCNECGLMFEDVYDLQRHIKSWCPELSAKKPRMDVNTAPESPQKLSTEDELLVFEELMAESKEANQREWQARVEKYTDQGLSNEDAEEKANEKMEDTDADTFIRLYSQMLKRIFLLQNGLVHNKVLKAIEQNKSDGYSLKHATRQALREQRDHILDLLEDGMSESESETSDSSEDSEEMEEEAEAEEEAEEI